MIVKTVEQTQLFEAERCVTGEGFESIRLLLEKDNMGFSLHKTIIPKGGPYHWHYKHHLEACFCIKGEGELINLETGQSYSISEDSLYVLDKHDDHTFEAFEDVELISIFNPPVTGREVHNSDGSYTQPEKPTALEIAIKLDQFTNHYDASQYLSQFLK